MAEPRPEPSDTSGGWLVFGCALVFWLIVPFPFWLLGIGFAGELVFLPDTWDVVSVLWVLAFYAPLALMAFVAFDGIRNGLNKDRDR